MRRILERSLLVVLGAIISCGGDGSGPSGPTPGNLTIQLNTSATNVGAVKFLIRGGTVSGVTSSYSTFDSPVPSGNHRVVVLGDLTAGTVATISVPDTRQAASYSATVEEVATRQTYALQSSGGFTMTIGE
ncbi:MAG: hypothetical protein ACREL6_10590 [Gemmatimonadales bacterium]